MHLELAASLSYLQERLQAQSSEVPWLDPLQLQPPQVLIHEGKRLAPLTFVAYYDLTAALMAGDEAMVRRSLDELEQAQPAPQSQVHRPLRCPDGCARSARYVELLCGDSNDDIGLKPLTAERADAFQARFERGMQLMRSAFPELAGEVDAIVHEVVAIGKDPDKAMQMDGASHYQLWGALFLNADFHHTDVAMMEVIAHESAHSLLFGLCTQEPLVDNDDEPVFASPLRADRRPMDGIYHATFVSARMHLAMTRLLESGLLDDDDHATAIAAIEADRLNFEAGDSVIREYGVLTRLGREVMEGARQYMAAA
jgi:HEXXH motif-containing protein